MMAFCRSVRRFRWWLERAQTNKLLFIYKNPTSATLTLAYGDKCYRWAKLIGKVHNLEI